MRRTFAQALFRGIVWGLLYAGILALIDEVIQHKGHPFDLYATVFIVGSVSWFAGFRSNPV